MADTTTQQPNIAGGGSTDDPSCGAEHQGGKYQGAPVERQAQRLRTTTPPATKTPFTLTQK